MPAKRLVLGLLWIAFFVAYLDRTNISVAGPAMMHDLGMSPQTFGYVLASFTAGYALVQIPGGWLADRFGAKIMLLIALLIWSAFTGLTDVAVSVGALIAIRVCFGLGEGLEQGAQFKAIGDTFPSPERSAASAMDANTPARKHPNASDSRRIFGSSPSGAHSRFGKRWVDRSAFG